MQDRRIWRRPRRWLSSKQLQPQGPLRAQLAQVGLALFAWPHQSYSAAHNFCSGGRHQKWGSHVGAPPIHRPCVPPFSMRVCMSDCWGAHTSWLRLGLLCQPVGLVQVPAPWTWIDLVRILPSAHTPSPMDPPLNLAHLPPSPFTSPSPLIINTIQPWFSGPVVPHPINHDPSWFPPASVTPAGSPLPPAQP